MQESLRKKSFVVQNPVFGVKDGLLVVETPPKKMRLIIFIVLKLNIHINQIKGIENAFLLWSR